MDDNDSAFYDERVYIRAPSDRVLEIRFAYQRKKAQCHPSLLIGVFDPRSQENASVKSVEKCITFLTLPDGTVLRRTLNRIAEISIRIATFPLLLLGV